jgi:hypothetical protein
VSNAAGSVIAMGCLLEAPPMPNLTTAVPASLTTMIDKLAAAIPARARATFCELLIGAAAT